MLAKTQDSNMIFGENKMKQAAGEMRGTAVKVEETTTGIVIHTDMGECLEMKVRDCNAAVVYGTYMVYGTYNCFISLDVWEAM
jgi:hypothetical protein